MPDRLSLRMGIYENGDELSSVSAAPFIHRKFPTFTSHPKKLMAIIVMFTAPNP